MKKNIVIYLLPKKVQCIIVNPINLIFIKQLSMLISYNSKYIFLSSKYNLF